MQRTMIIIAMLALLGGHAVQAAAETCEYDTEWGILTIYYDWNTETASGYYPYQNGQIEGYWSGQETLEGQWWQNDSNGYFVFYFNASGFTGSWMYANDSNWQGNWDGNLRGCY